MSSQNKNPNVGNTQESKHEGGREFGHVHEPTQAQQASRNKGLAANQPSGNQQPKSEQPQHSGPGTDHRAESQQNKPPGNAPQGQRPGQTEDRQREKKSA